MKKQLIFISTFAMVYICTAYAAEALAQTGSAPSVFTDPSRFTPENASDNPVHWHTRLVQPTPAAHLEETHKNHFYGTNQSNSIVLPQNDGRNYVAQAYPQLRLHIPN